MLEIKVKHQHSTLRKYFFNFGTLDYGPQKILLFKVQFISFFLYGQLEIVNTWSGKYGGTRAQRTHHLGLQSMLGRDLTSNTF